MKEATITKYLEQISEKRGHRDIHYKFDIEMGQNVCKLRYSHK